MQNFALCSLCILLTFLPETHYPGENEAGAGRSNGAPALTMRTPVMKDRVVAHLSIDSTIRDVLAHPGLRSIRLLFASPSTSLPPAQQLRAAYPERTPFEFNERRRDFHVSEGRK
jgi:hypothetical protein